MSQITVAENQKTAFSIAEISEQTTLSEAYLRRKIEEGILKATRFGRRVLVRREDYESFLKQGVTN